MSMLVSSFGSISGSIGATVNSTTKTFALTFEHGWGVGCLFDWYRGFPSNPKARSIQTIQIRKDVSGPVPHRFIVLRMCDDQAHRVDRRPDRPNANTVDLLTNQAVACKDELMANISLASVDSSTECEVELTLDGQVDVMSIISTCYAISGNSSTRDYQFLRYNCFFFSWTILMVVSRQYLPYEVPEPASVLQRFNSQLDRITETIVDDAIALFLDIVIETITIFRDKAGSSLHGGMNPMARVAWALPIGVLQFLWRRLFAVRLHLGLRVQLTRMVKTEIGTIATQVQEATITKHIGREALDEHLWIEDTEATLTDALKVETMKVLWKSILEAISACLGNIEPEQLAAELTDPHLKFTLLGRNAAQWCAVWNAALHGGLQAAKRTSGNLEGLSHGEAFDQAWYAARDAALDAAKIVVENTRKSINKPQRDAMWQSVWTIWNDCWDETHKTVQGRSVQTVEKVVREILATAAKAVIEDMKQSRTKTIVARMQKKEQTWLGAGRSGKGSGITNAELQRYMHKVIEKDTINKDALNAVHASMGDVWKLARQHFSLIVTSLDPIIEQL
ncbi:hypothetical protein FRC12_011748 [Ceratobasidium sp. 428]|nr:hypothetical protein FRC12_011748 [Ceratobasidium sp. 428]